jgi:hypothetical protein
MQPLNKLMPFRPWPVQGELFKGYILRLASRNGRDKPNDFVNAFRPTYKVKSRFSVGTQFYDEFLTVLAISMGVDKEMLAENFKNEERAQMFDWLSVKRMSLDHATICPSCVAKYGFLKADWHLYYATHCIEHESKLWKSCPQCGKALDWKGGILKGCTHCDLEWKDVSPIKDKLPSSQIALSNATGKKKEELISKLLSNLKVSLRPFDASIQKPRDVDLFVDDLSTHIEHAFQLAHSQVVIDDLKKARKQHWQSKIGGSSQVAFFDKFEAANDETFEELSANFEYKVDGVVELKEASHMVLSAHRRLNSPPEKACLELSWSQLEKVLKMSELDIKKLIKGGVIPGRMHANSPLKVSPSRLDDVIHFFRAVKQHSTPLNAANDEFIAWGDDKALSHFRVSTQKLAQRVSIGDVPIFGPAHDDHLFEDFYFRKSDLSKRFGCKSANIPLVQNPKKQIA